MMILAFLFIMVSLKVYKKTTPNGKVTVFLGKRDFLDYGDGKIDPVEGVVHVEKDYLNGRKVFAQLLTTYRYGREEDEVMGVKFSRVLPLDGLQIIPCEKQEKVTKLQQRLLDKLGGNAFPFSLRFPGTAPSSVVVQSGDDYEDAKPLGVEYRVRTFVGDNIDHPGHKRSTVSLTIKKLQFAPIMHLDRLPSALASRDFTFSHGKVSMEITLNKEVFYHGEPMYATLTVTNNSRKCVKQLKLYVMQHVELTMVNMQLMNMVASVETHEGCPITPRHSFSKEFMLIPLAVNNKERRGVALDGFLKDDDVNLASSTLSVSGKSTPESLGIVVGYSVRAKLGFGTLGGELIADVPVKLVNEKHLEKNVKPISKRKKVEVEKIAERPHYENNFYAADDDENIIVEDFERNRLSEAED